MNTSWHSYPVVFALGHKALEHLLDDSVVVQEKIDGSQFSWGIFDGELKCRSKGAQINMLAPEGMFTEAVATVNEVKKYLVDGWTYRAEYLKKPKHNALAYDRVPNKHLILFDVNPTEEEYVGPTTLASIARLLGLESVPLLHDGFLTDMQVLRDLLARESILGGQKIEGVVVKNYSRFGSDKKALMGKFVSEAYKEVHAKEWGEANPKQGDILQRLIERYRTPARWQKAMIHLRERGELEDSPRDIGKLIPEIGLDVEKECREEIMEELYKWAWPQVRRGVTAGFPEWFKEELLKQQFAEMEDDLLNIPDEHIAEAWTAAE